MTRLLSRFFPLSLFLLALCTLSMAQPAKQYTVSGYIKDVSSGEVLQNATITAAPSAVTVQSNAYGYFSLSLPEGKYTIAATYAGYTAFRSDISLTGNLTIAITLTSASG